MQSESEIFMPGQRWLSDGESELGLGVIEVVDERSVRVGFPAVGKSRTYARRSAPLSRARFGPGDRIRDREGWELGVIEADSDDGLLTYLCEDLDGNRRKLPEGELDDRLRLNRPQERLLAGRIDRDNWFSLRYEAWLQGAEEAGSPVLGLVGARMALVPHQLYIGHEVAERYAPRVLLADEVGLGKTIEAGLILHRLLLTGRARRVLLVVPEPLLHQWLVEMLRRFNLRFALYDQERFDAVEEENPFQAEQRVLCSLEFLLSSPEVARAALAGEWDLLVVDEAHHLEWTENGENLDYELIAALAEESAGVLLLTATPEQLGRAGHFGRLRMLDPHRFHDYAAFIDEERDYVPVAAAASKLLEGQALSDDEQSLIDRLCGDAETTQQQVEWLLDRHGTGRVLFRNTRSAIKGFPGREPLPYPLLLPEEYAALDVSGSELVTPERTFGPGWARIDPRVGWLAQLLRELRPEKVLAICAHAETAVELREELQRREGSYAALFHEGMEIVERDRAAAYFADPEEGSQLLICSEIGSEGRNFQFAHHLVLFDLPLDPDLLEQRIGRLDRIGQSETIRLHIPYLESSAGELLYRWYAEGLDAFAATSPAASAVYARLRERLLTALDNPSDADPLLKEAGRLREQLNQELEAGRDRLLELHSHRPERSAVLLEQIESLDHSREVNGYMTRYWDAYGVEQEPGPGRSVVLHSGNHMLHESFPGLPRDGATVTFARADALAHEDREFLTWEHPMVRGAMEQLSGSDLGSAAITVLQESGLAPGTVMLELIYIAECPAPAELEVGRFLPPTALRLLVDQKGRDRAADYPHATLCGEDLSRNRRITEALVKTMAGKLRPMLERGELLAKAAAAGIEQEAKERMQQVLDEELGRLQALAGLNAGVREDELEYLEARRDLLTRYLAKCHLRLDAVRVVAAG